jgi:hypothetical protein
LNFYQSKDVWAIGPSVPLQFKSNTSKTASVSQSLFAVLSAAFGISQGMLGVGDG